MSLLDQLHALGFDDSYKSREGGVRVRCSQCDALVINRTPTHERGCPNVPRPDDDELDVEDACDGDYPWHSSETD